jgi:hypothetical protein
MVRLVHHSGPEEALTACGTARLNVFGLRLPVTWVVLSGWPAAKAVEPATRSMRRHISTPTPVSVVDHRMPPVPELSRTRRRACRGNRIDWHLDSVDYHPALVSPRSPRTGPCAAASQCLIRPAPARDEPAGNRFPWRKRGAR